MLPILAHADAIRASIADAHRLVLTAPPGTGKSTQLPQILWPATGELVVLQPRRIAARALASRVAAERGEAVGQSIGYHVRHERVGGPQTRVWFATYGIFWQRILATPKLPGVTTVILDEFHERTLEADACLAWLRTRPDIDLVVTTATPSGAPPLGPAAAHLVVDEHLHPVAIDYMPPKPSEGLPAHAARAFTHLLDGASTGSVLVFMPGQGEIRRTAEALDGPAGRHGYTVLELHGGMRLEDQQRALALPAEQPCVVVATNVAETSLTIPGVTTVIDAGLARQAAYDAERDLDTLNLGWIARTNATQRAGRAGRQGPGRCLRLWSRGQDSSLVAAQDPEIARLDLAGLALAAATLPGPLDWLDAPPAARWAQAQARLTALGALNSAGRATALGRELLRFPLPPALARVVLAAREADQGTLVAAMVAIYEATDRRAIADDGDLYRLAVDLLVAPRGGRRWDREVTASFRQLERLARPTPADGAAGREAHVFGSPADDRRREAVTRCWLLAFDHRLASRRDGVGAPSPAGGTKNRAYQLADGTKGTVAAGAPATDAILALSLHEQAGSGKTQVSIPLYLPVDPTWLPAQGEPELVCRWDAAKQRVVQERHWKHGDVVVRREPAPHDAWDKEAAGAMLVAKLLAGEARMPAREDEAVAQFVYRVQTVAAAWPEMGLPAFDEGDWEVLYHELLANRSTASDVPVEAVTALLREYVGSLAPWLERMAPAHWPLPGGRNGRLTYFADAPPELSARLGDMLGMAGGLAIADGRVAVCFDILAPNMRTVQKTFDMTGFWRNTYPEVRKELKRRYPRHPWPEAP